LTQIIKGKRIRSKEEKSCVDCMSFLSVKSGFSVELGEVVRCDGISRGLLVRHASKAAWIEVTWSHV
jgi:hypothetical protein